MIIWIILACILLLFVLTLSVRGKIILEYTEEFKVTLSVLGMKFPLFPKKPPKKGPHSMSRRRAKKIKQQVEKKRKKEAEKARQKKEAKQAKKEAQKKAKSEGAKQQDKLSVGEVLDIVSFCGTVLKALVGRFFKHLRVHMVRLRIVVATGDAATTALAYSAVSESIRVLLPLLEQIPSFRFPDMADIDLGLDYLQESSQVDLRMEFSLRLWHLYSILFHTLRVSLSKGIPLLKQHWDRQEGEPGGHKPPQAKKKADR